MTIAEMHAEVAAHLSEIAELFVPGVKVTFIARTPGNYERDVFIGNDDPKDVMELCARSIARSTIQPVNQVAE